MPSQEIDTRVMRGPDGKSYRARTLLGAELKCPGGSLVVDAEPRVLMELIDNILNAEVAEALEDGRWSHAPNGYDHEIEVFGNFVRLGSDTQLAEDQRVGWMWISLDALRQCSIRPTQIVQVTQLPIEIAGAN